MSKAKLIGDPRLKVLVVALDQGGGDADALSQDKLRHELSLVRSAVLYADAVTLLSAGAELLLGYQDRLADADPSYVWELIGRVPGLQEKVSQLPDVPAALEEIGNRIRQSDGIWRREYAELQAGRGSGLLSVSSFTSGPWTGRDEDAQDGVRFRDQLRDLLNDPSMHPLLDRRAAEYARAVQQEVPEAVTAGAHRRARLAEVGAGMIARLPAFPGARLDELLDLKSEMVGPLARYRAVVGELQKLIAVGMGSIEMDSELDDLWVTKVRPALTDLEESLIDHSFVRELARSAATSAKALVTQGPGLYIALSTLADLAAHIAAVAAAAGVAIETTAVAADSVSTTRRAVRHDDFYYLYRLQERASVR